MESYYNHQKYIPTKVKLHRTIYKTFLTDWTTLLDNWVATLLISSSDNMALSSAMQTLFLTSTSVITFLVTVPNDSKQGDAMRACFSSTVSWGLPKNCFARQSSAAPSAAKMINWVDLMTKSAHISPGGERTTVSKFFESTSIELMKTYLTWGTNFSS